MEIKFKIENNKLKKTKLIILMIILTTSLMGCQTSTPTKKQTPAPVIKKTVSNSDIPDNVEYKKYINKGYEVEVDIPTFLTSKGGYTMGPNRDYWEEPFETKDYNIGITIDMENGTGQLEISKPNYLIAKGITSSGKWETQTGFCSSNGGPTINSIFMQNHLQEMDIW